MPDGFLLGMLSVMGLLIGSFLNVVIHRLPIMIERDETAERYDLVQPPSTCPGCGHRIRPHENVPLLSWLWLRGRCAACGRAISVRYPLVEALGAVVPLVLAPRFGLTPELLAATVFAWAALCIVFIDLEHLLIPDAITQPLLWLGLLLSLRPTFANPRDAILGAVAGYGAFWLVDRVGRWTLGRTVIGQGDLKLFAATGAWLGWQFLPLVLIIASSAGSAVGLALIALGRHGLGRAIPFGPFLILGALVALGWGEPILAWYWARLLP